MEDPMISRTPLDDAYERCQADNDALRERAERAEAERNELHEHFRECHHRVQQASTAIEAVYAAIKREAWEDGPTIESAIETTVNAAENLKSLLRQDIESPHALRRAMLAELHELRMCLAEFNRRAESAEAENTRLREVLETSRAFVALYCSRYATDHGLSVSCGPGPDEWHPEHRKLWSEIESALRPAGQGGG